MENIFKYSAKESQLNLLCSKLLRLSVLLCQMDSLLMYLSSKGL